RHSNQLQALDVFRAAVNVECLELITMPWLRAVRGNHEQMMIDGLSEYGNVNHWLVNGGGWFFNLDYDKEVLAKALVHKAAELPLIIELVNTTIKDMQARQRDVAALDAKYTGELADAKETIERLHSDVIAGRKRLHVFYGGVNQLDDEW
ncbi:lysis system i-spanin subunit Rz, partial [Bacillus sp. SS-TM]